MALLGRAGADRVRVSACIQLIAKLVACPPLVKPYRTWAVFSRVEIQFSTLSRQIIACLARSGHNQNNLIIMWAPRGPPRDELQVR